MPDYNPPASSLPLAIFLKRHDVIDDHVRIFLDDKLTDSYLGASLGASTAPVIGVPQLRPRKGSVHWIFALTI